jgi:sulfate adenylyltransferase
MRMKDSTVTPETVDTVEPSAVGRLISPYGGSLGDLMAGRERREELRAASRDWPSWNLSARQVCDLELLLNGGFSPLPGFMCRADYDSVCRLMRLADGTLWPIPITLDVSEEAARELERGGKLVLRDPEGVMLAVLHVEESWRADKTEEALRVFGTASPEHPGVAYLFDQANPYYVGGRLEGIELPRHYDFRHLRLSPLQLRGEFSKCGWSRVVAFQTRNPMHRAHLELTLRAAETSERIF